VQHQYTGTAGKITNCQIGVFCSYVSPDCGEANDGTYYARELSGAERERGFQRALSLNPGWRRFQKRAGERVIPVVRLDGS
jgi:hypothetical protein